jgi:Flp pilus assembly protein TadD
MTVNNTHKKPLSSTRPEFLFSLFLIVATLFVYLQVRNHEFITYDDGTYITKNPYLQTGLSTEAITWSFTATRASNWHPLTWLSHLLDIQLYEMNPGGHHFTNVLFHIANTLLLFLVFRRMTGNLWRSGFVAAMFALHPLHVESVAWVAERKDVLSAFFWMLTMWSYVRYVEHTGCIRYLLILLFFVLGLMAKPMLVTLPFVLLLLDYWPLYRFQFGQSGDGGSKQQKFLALRLVWEKIPLFALAIVSGIVTFLVQQSGGALGSFTAYTLNVRVANALVSYVNYIVKTIWPSQLAVLYPHPPVVSRLMVAGACFLLISIFLLAIRVLKRHPWFTVGWLWYVGTLVPVIGLVQIGSQAMADRYTYVPLIGISIIIAWGVPELMARWRYRKTALATITAISLSVIMTTTWLQVRYWRNSITLFEHTLDVTVNNYVAHSNLGIALFFQGKLDRSIEHFHKALRINPGFVDARINLGIALANQGRMDDAISHFLEASRINPDSYETHNSLGVALERQGNTAKAVSHYYEALRIKPDFDEAHNNLGVALASQGKLDEAIEHYSEALRVNPRFAKVHNNLGIAMIHKGKLEEAISHFREALRIKPDYTNAHDNLERALALLRK